MVSLPSVGGCVWPLSIARQWLAGPGPLPVAFWEDTCLTL